LLHARQKMLTNAVTNIADSGGGGRNKKQNSWRLHCEFRGKSQSQTKQSTVTMRAKHLQEICNAWTICKSISFFSEDEARQEECCGCCCARAAPHPIVLRGNSSTSTSTVVLPAVLLATASLLLQLLLPVPVLLVLVSQY
jgi:hypothetical protein